MGKNLLRSLVWKPGTDEYAVAIVFNAGADDYVGNNL